ncbi:phosphatase PAP2 family protein [Rhodovulum marinum]|uniref:phosphatase PAP2 family protein n=1 Tax=Rhodovulum marinum TaxID=320662 RepID=UPI0014052578|nr:phosphatase PAP2 family protein [Rhodovulum marinum]
MLLSLPEIALQVFEGAAVFLVGLAVPLAFLRNGAGRSRAGGAVFVALAGTLFHLTFLTIKTSLPDIVPFFADPALSRFDSWLHGGIAPWELTHGLLAGVPAWIFERLYIDVWIVVIFCFPVVVTLADGDARRRARFFALYVFVWVGIGNVLALAGMSVGPVYHDRLTGLDVFGGLDTALAASGIAATYTGALQDTLWSLYVDGQNSAASGISAFPSVHVAMTTLVALYIFERVPRAWPLSLLLVLGYLVMSVHLGWHYAVDGYASILLVGAVWGVLRRVSRSRETLFSA